jgi:putative transcriptional regulator
MGMYYNPDIFKIQSNNLVPRKGRVLIAEPFLPGNYFNRAVILIVAYSNKGTVGFILNKQIELKVQDYLIDFPDFNAPVYIGGPVSTDTIYFIHTRGDIIPGSIQVLDNVFWGGDFDELKRCADMGLIQPSEVRFFLGYSGWDAGQLEHEIKENSWLVNDVESETVMHRLNLTSWADFVKKVGEKYRIWTNFPENPSMN